MRPYLFCLCLSQKGGEIFATVASDRGRKVLYQIGGVMSVMHDRGSNALNLFLHLNTVSYNLILDYSKCRTVTRQASWTLKLNTQTGNLQRKFWNNKDKKGEIVSTKDAAAAPSVLCFGCSLCN